MGVTLTPDAHYGRTIVGNKVFETGTFAHTGTYTAGTGLTEAALLAAGTALNRAIDSIILESADYKFTWDGSKVTAYNDDVTCPGADFAFDIVDSDSPGGNQIYVKFGAGGIPYLACNMATDTANKFVTLGTGVSVAFIHDATASTNGFGLTVDDDGTQPDRLIADLSGGPGTDVYIPTSHPDYFVKIKNAAAGGVAVNFDDGATDQLASTTAGNADTTCQIVRRGLAEVPTGTMTISGGRYFIVGR